jgi:hypothetical protein
VRVCVCGGGVLGGVEGVVYHERQCCEWDWSTGVDVGVVGGGMGDGGGGGGGVCVCITRDNAVRGTPGGSMCQ